MSNMSSDTLGKKRETEWADGKFLVLVANLPMDGNIWKPADSGQKISVFWSEMREERSQ